MFGIFAKTIRAATRTDRWDAPDHWAGPRYPQGGRHMREREREAKLRAIRQTGMW